VETAITGRIRAIPGRTLRALGWVGAWACAGCALEAPSVRPSALTEASRRVSAPAPAADADAMPVSVRAALPPALVAGLTGGGERPRDEAVKPATSTDPSIPVVVGPPVVPPAPMEYPIDLTTALRLAEVENPEIAETRQRIRVALGVLQGARVLAVPTLNAGLNYHGHTGNLQRSSGRILSVSEQSLYFGGGARTLAAESISIPAVNIVSPLADVLFEPLAARQEVDRATFDASATTNAVLLEVATLHFDLIGAEASLELRRETEAEGREVSRLTTVYAETGQGLQSDADRAATLFGLIHRAVQRAEEDVAVASTRLARRLHLDPVVRIRPVVARIEPITLIDLNVPTEALVGEALRHRPEVGARAAALGVAQTRSRQEKLRPFLPNVWLGFSGGAFGGGSNLVTPLVGNFAGRTDFDVRLFWTLQNMGFGNLGLWRQREAQVGVALGEQSRMIALVRREVAAARAQAIATRGQVDVTARQLATAQDGFREDLTRIRGTVGLPIEVTNSLELLSDARQAHLRAILDYNRAQFRLFVSLGAPPPLEHPDCGPLPPAPIAPPPLPLPPVS
jgi:outer membrane protein TolC